MADETLENELRAIEAFLEQELGEVLGNKPQGQSTIRRNQK